MAGMHVAVTCERVQDFAALGLRWRALEAQAGPHSFFQSWSWIGCLAEERYPDPVLLRAERDGATIGLALLNRRHGRLCLAESGDPVMLWAREAEVVASINEFHENQLFLGRFPPQLARVQCPTPRRR